MTLGDEPEGRLDEWVRRRVLAQLQAVELGLIPLNELALCALLEGEIQTTLIDQCTRQFFKDQAEYRRFELIFDAVDYWLSHHRVKIAFLDRDKRHIFRTGRIHIRTLKYLGVLDAIVDATTPPVLLSLDPKKFGW